jgi:predicted ArsR family transcriptional regulator
MSSTVMGMNRNGELAGIAPAPLDVDVIDVFLAKNSPRICRDLSDSLQINPRQIRGELKDA